ncbi:MAG: hypothetical protein M1600_03490 [Firmicutes bacterium]|nr:hypothetical protein [Bacillota bacterium]
MSSHTTGRGRSPRARLDKDGFPRACLTQPKRHGGFLTGDMVKAGLDYRSLVTRGIAVYVDGGSLISGMILQQFADRNSTRNIEASPLKVNVYEDHNGWISSEA